MKNFCKIFLLITFLASLNQANALNLNLFNSNNGEIQSNYNDANSYIAVNGNKEIPTKEIDSIHINWINGEIKFKKAKNNNLTFSEKPNQNINEDLTLHYYKNGKNLYIQYCKAGKHAINSLTKDLTITIPEKARLKQLTITSSSANVEGKLPSIDRLTINNMSGETDLKSNYINTIEATQTSGELELDVVENEKCTITQSSGDVETEFHIAPKDINIQSMSGSVEIKLPYGTTCNYSISTMSGSKKSDFANKDNGECNIKVNTMSGNVKIKTR